MNHDFKEDIHVTLADGRTIYWPKGDMTRLAPAAVCSVASRLVRLRAELKKEPSDIREIERLINEPIAFEDKFLSGDSTIVHNAIRDTAESFLLSSVRKLVGAVNGHYLGQIGDVQLQEALVEFLAQHPEALS